MTTRQDRFLVDDINRSRVRDSLPELALHQHRVLTADYRLAEYPDTARLLVRERHGLLTRQESDRLGRLRGMLVKLDQMVQA